MPTTRTRRDKPGYQRKKREVSEERQEELRRFVEKIQHLQPSAFQERIFEAAKTGQGQFVVNAGPGSGKTTTAIKLSTFFPGRAIYFSFNKKIQVDTNEKLRVLGSKMFALTLHAFGKSCIEKYLGRESDVDDDKYSRLIDDFVSKRFPAFLLGLRHVDDEELATMQFDAKAWARDLVHYVQVTLSPPSEAVLLALIDQFSLNDINPSAKVWPLVVGAVVYALQEGMVEFRQSGKISFDDMVCYPAALAEIPVRQFDHVIIDEAQDLNKAQLRLVQRACHPDTQVFAVGDKKQSIYAFKRGRGRPRKGGANAALRKGFEVTFDLRTIELLDAATDNRSEYLETLALGRLAPQAGEEQLAAKLEARCNAFPALVAKKLRKIRATLGVRAAWEASEAVILFVDPQRAYYP